MDTWSSRSRKNASFSSSRSGSSSRGFSSLGGLFPRFGLGVLEDDISDVLADQCLVFEQGLREGVECPFIVQDQFDRFVVALLRKGFDVGVDRLTLRLAFGEQF